MVTIMPLHVISILCIILIPLILLIGYLKKWLMVFVIIIANFVLFFVSLAFSTEVIGDLAFRPVYLSVQYFPQLYTLVTSMFLHSVTDPLHIIFNTLMFLLIAPNFENRVGRNKLLGIYLSTGVVAAIFHAYVAPLFSTSFDPYIGLIGASGAISGVIGAYAFTYPRDTVFFPVGFIIMKIPVLAAGAFFIAVQSLFAIYGGDASVAYFAHIGGFLSGIIIAAVFLRAKAKEESSMGTSGSSKDQSSAKKFIDFSTLKTLATTNELKDMVHRIEKENVPQVRDIWLEHFLEKITCPVCHKPLNHLDRRIWCEENHFKTAY